MGAFAGAVGASNEQRDSDSIKGAAAAAVGGGPSNKLVIKIPLNKSQSHIQLFIFSQSTSPHPQLPLLLPEAGGGPDMEEGDAGGDGGGSGQSAVNKKAIPESAITSFQAWWENQIDKGFDEDF